jgi:uncharacterized protein with NRDE domain
MCTLALYLRQFEDHPLVIAANRDEHLSRPSAPPGLLRKEPAILAGKDLVAGGTWLGVNEYGLAAGIVNRSAKINDVIAEPRSRGLLCLDMLKGKDAAYARKLLDREDASRYAPFVLLIASTTAAFVAYNAEKRFQAVPLDGGVHVFGNRSFSGDDRGKLKRAHDLFSGVRESLSVALQGSATNLDSAVKVLRTVLSDHALADNFGEAKDAICVHTGNPDYGTVSSSIIVQSRAGKKFHVYHAAGAPCRTNFEAMKPLKLT